MLCAPCIVVCTAHWCEDLSREININLLTLCKSHPHSLKHNCQQASGTRAADHIKLLTWLHELTSGESPRSTDSPHKLLQYEDFDKAADPAAIQAEDFPNGCGSPAAETERSLRLADRGEKGERIVRGTHWTAA